jgi:hypothetical protein
MSNNNKNNFEENDKESVNSDISNNTDMKVFHGAINAKNFLVNPKGGNVNKNDYKNIFNLDKEDNFVSTKKIQTGIKNNNNSISIFKINQINNNLLNSNINNNNNNINNKEIIPPQIKPKLNKKINDNNKNNKNNNDNENEILSFRNELSSQFLFSNQNNYPIENNNDNNTNNNNKEQLLLKFKNITKEDEEIINNGFIPDIKENKKNFRNLRNSQTSFKIANIEKGIALLVSSEDCIFTIPTFLLPKNCKVGTTYTFLVEEMNKPIQIKHKINVLQKNYLKDYNINNNINNN